MKQTLFISSAALLAGVAVWGQVRIAELTGEGVLAWTNSTFLGIYEVGTAESAAGPWNLLSLVADPDPKLTNRISTRVPLTNDQAFYRVGWQAPEPDGVWELECYVQGALVVTGQLTLVNQGLIATNPMSYQVGGHRVTGSVGAPYGWPVEGTGTVSGVLIPSHGSFRAVWPPTHIGLEVTLDGAMGAALYTGRWYQIGTGSGHYNAVKISSIPGTNRP